MSSRIETPSALQLLKRAVVMFLGIVVILAIVLSINRMGKPSPHFCYGDDRRDVFSEGAVARVDSSLRRCREGQWVPLTSDR